MKKLLSLVMVFVFVVLGLVCVQAEAIYDFNYKIENVEYKSGNEFEADIAIYVDECVSGVTVECNAIIAVYNNETGKFLGCSVDEYWKRYAFDYDTQRNFSCTVLVEDLTVKEYLFKVILLENLDTLRSTAYVKGNENSFVLKNNIDEVKISLDYTKEPMVVKSVSDGWVTGLVNGGEVNFKTAQKPVKIGITGIENEDTYEIGVNDVIWYALNKNNEIVSYRHLVNYDNGSYYGMLSTAGDERNNEECAALLYNLNTLKPADVQPDTKQLCGYAVAGLPHYIGNVVVEVFKSVDSSLSENQLTSFSNLKDVYFNSKTYTYSLGKIQGDIQLSSFYALRTYEMIGDISFLNKLVYAYSYDDYNTCNLIFDYSKN